MKTQFSQLIFKTPNLFAGTIAASWFVSPLMSGLACIIVLTLIRKLIMDAKNPLSAGLIALPIIYGLTVFLNVLTVTLNGSKRTHKTSKYRASIKSISTQDFSYSTRHGKSSFVACVCNEHRGHVRRWYFMSAFRSAMATEENFKRWRHN